MRLLRRRDTPPDALRALLGDEERVVSWADTDDGSAVAATQRGLWWPEAAGHRLVGWQHIDKAIWRDGQLIVTEADVVDDLLLVDRAPVAARLAVPRDLPPIVRARVEANVVRSELVAIATGQVRIVARRVPGRDGLVCWARLADGTPDNAVTRADVEELVERLRAGLVDRTL
jgi:hypothetical protein